MLLTLDAQTGASLEIDNENPLNPLAWEAVVSQPWLHLSASQGTTPAAVDVTIDPTGLAPGQYGATITVNSGAGSKTINVAASVASSCVGDCDGTGGVAINELIRGVNIALGNAPLSDCTSFDANYDGMVAINELIQAVNNALNGCGQP